MSEPLPPRPPRPSLRVQIARIRAALAELSRRTLGSIAWTPPAWVAELRDRERALRADMLADTRTFRRNAAIGGGGLILVVAAVVLWRHRPHPVLTAFQITPPPGTDLTVDNPKPNPLRISFAASVAPLKSFAKPVTTGVDLSPRIAGTWRWVGDRELDFLPADDWPVGQTFTVTFDKKGMFAPTVTLEEYKFDFSSAPFVAQIATAEFYQDPVDPNLKRVVVHLMFSHPLDTASLSRQVTMRMEGPGGGFLSSMRSLPFTVSADKKRLNASIMSDPLPIPDKDAQMRVTIGTGVKSSRGGPGTPAALEQRVVVPGMFSLSVQSAQLTLVRNERYEPEQVMVLGTSADVGEKDIQQHVNAWMLPVYNPKTPADQRKYPYQWGPAEVGPDVLAASTPLTLTPIPAEREHTSTVAFKYEADPGRFVYVRVNRGLRSFGGYVLGETWDHTALVPPFPQEVKILGSGSLLSLGGERRISIYSRDVPGLLVEVGRVLPEQLQHLVTQTSLVFGNTEFTNPNFDVGNLTARQSDTIRLPSLGPGKAHYQPYDLGRYLSNGGAPRGLFLVSVQGYDSAARRTTGPTDRRLILLTDLGLLAKQNGDGSRDLFVQSLRSGLPVAGATVNVVGENGLTVLSAETDGDGHAHFPTLKAFERERTPVLYSVQRGEDLSFLPMDKGDRELDLSRFDIGGVANAIQADKLSAFLFSDRGVYRPGDAFHVGIIVKPADWLTRLEGIPLEIVVNDARGLEVKRQRIRLSAQAFEEFTYTTAETSPTGSWTVSLYIVKDGRAGALLGTVPVLVREFQPDRLAMTVHLSTESQNGWVTPDTLRARISLRNLFGTPAVGRRVSTTIQLTPGFPSLRGFEDYHFLDPQKAKETYTEDLPDVTTDAKGEAEIPLGLERFTRATYRLRVITEGYEPEGGRSVTAEVGAVVSNLPFIVGSKPDGDLQYLHKDSERNVSLVALGPDGKALSAAGLHLARIRISYVSVLARQFDGTYKYQSVKKEIPLGDSVVTIPVGTLTVPLVTAEPGTFALVVRDSAGTELSRVEYNVAGAANLARSLERNAELQVSLDKPDYAPGETVELQIQAPYTGSGLITIERDHVYAWRWFHTTTTSSVQHIPIPAGLEGNGYVSVAFTRDANSDEIFTSPLSYGVAPFSVSLERRKQPITLDAPSMVKPGDVVHVHYQTDHPSRIAVFAVDEGILQVASYHTPDPLGFFFQKRALDVRTSQILDLILPEFQQLMDASAPGGDQGAAIGRNLNPFKRKRDKPVAFWSGVRDADAGGGDFTFTAPDYYNGTLRVMAVAVNEDAVGAAETKALVRGDFVLSPNVPLMVAPGDTFDVSVGVANNIANSGKAARIQVAVQVPPSLQMIGSPSTTIPVDAMGEGAVVFHLRATEKLGNADLTFTARLGEKSAHLTQSLSLRPAVPYRTALIAGTVKQGSASVAVDRDLYPELRAVRGAISVVPLGLARGLAEYLDKYPYGCTEQLVSEGVPAMVLARRPEFGITTAEAATSFGKVIDMLRSRQNEEGAYGLWAGNAHVDPFVSVYAQHFLLDARERGFAVPPEVIANGWRYLIHLASTEGNSLYDERIRAYAIYLLTRSGMVTTGFATALDHQVRENYPRQWTQDLTAAFLASTYQLLKQEGLAGNIIGAMRFNGDRVPDYAEYDDNLTHDSMLLYLLSRHFPSRLPSLQAQAIQGIVGPIQAGAFNSLSSATAILGLDAYVTAVGPQAAGKFTLSETMADGSQHSVTLSTGTFPDARVTLGARKVTFGSEAREPAFYLLNQSGFDRTIPAKPLSQQLEVLREYTDKNGNAVSSVGLGDEIQVHLKFRAVGQNSGASVALVDLLPGGFEIVEDGGRAQQPPQIVLNRPVDSTSAEAEGDGGEEGDAGSPELAWTPPFGEVVGNWSPEYVEAREDRVVVYGFAEQNIQEFVYTIKATAAGSFAVPPAFGEGMYDRGVKAWSQAGRMVVKPR